MKKVEDLEVGDREGSGFSLEKVFWGLDIWI